jgi:hypothetical protein
MKNSLREPVTFTPDYWAERVAVLRAAVASGGAYIDPVLLETALEGAEAVLQMDIELAGHPLVGWTYNDDEVSDLVAARSADQALAILRAGFPDRSYSPECVDRVDDNGIRNKTWCFEETPEEKFTWPEFIKRIAIPRHLAGVFY